MPLIRERGIFMLSARVLNMCSAALLQSHRLKVAEALSLMADTEDFGTYRTIYIPSKMDVEVLIQLKDNCLAELTKDFDHKRLLRPLIDCIERAKRLTKA
jgi:hypothetical protein